MKSKHTRSLPAIAGLALFASAAHAAPLQITDITLAGSFTAGTPETITGNATITSFTTSEGTFASLIGATANSVTATNSPYYIGTGPAPTLNTDATSVSGLTVNDAANNFASGNFQFTGLALNASTRFFILENTPVSSTSGDPTTVQLINSANSVVGSFSLSLLPANFTTTAANTTGTALATVTYTSGTGNLVGKLGGVSFSFADLGVTDYDAISSVTGLRLVSANLLDPSVVGAYSAVPEPGAFAAIAGFIGLAAVLSRRSRRG